jgi:integrase
MRLAPTVKLISIQRQKQTSFGIEINGGESLGIPPRTRKMISLNKREAENYATQVRADLMHGKLGILTPPLEKIPLRELAKRYVAHKRHHIRTSTEKRYINHSEGFLRFTDSLLPEVSADARRLNGSLVNEFLGFALDKAEDEEENRKQWSRKTVNECLKFMKSVYKFGIGENIVENNPFESVPLLRVASHGRVEFFTNQQLTRIYAEIDTHWLDVIKFFVLTGIRKGELIHLVHNCVNITERPYIQYST